MARNYIVLDTEGVDTQKRTDGQPNPSSGLFYDMGYLVIDGETGETIEARSFINSDVFFNLALMRSAYYAEKRPQYLDGMGTDWEVASTLTIYRTLKEDIKAYEVRDIWAYNARYDMAIAKCRTGFRHTLPRSNAVGAIFGTMPVALSAILRSS